MIHCRSMCAQGGIASVIRLVLIASGHPGVGGVLFFHFAPPQLSETAPTFIARFCVCLTGADLIASSDVTSRSLRSGRNPDDGISAVLEPPSYERSWQRTISNVTRCCWPLAMIVGREIKWFHIVPKDRTSRSTRVPASIDVSRRFINS